MVVEMEKKMGKKGRKKGKKGRKKRRKKGFYNWLAIFLKHILRLLTTQRSLFASRSAVAGGLEQAF